MQLRHDFVFILSQSLNDKQVEALKSDLESVSFNVAIRKEEESGNWLFFVGLHDETKMLKEAEIQMIMVPRVYKNAAKKEAQSEKLAKQKDYLHKKVIASENKKPFKLQYRDEFAEGDIDHILTEADKSRLFYIIFSKVKLS